jgi:hypothetical protein
MPALERLESYEKMTMEWPPSEQAIAAIAVPVASLMIQLDILARFANTYFAHRIDKLVHQMPALERLESYEKMTMEWPPSRSCVQCLYNSYLLGMNPEQAIAAIAVPVASLMIQLDILARFANTYFAVPELASIFDAPPNVPTPSTVNCILPPIISPAFKSPITRPANNPAKTL